jgi:two-component system, cell cycle sensor histidine kinase and response regulator CckA
VSGRSSSRDPDSPDELEGEECRRATCTAAASPGPSPAALAEALVQTSVDGLLAFDRECRYTLWNEAMERFSGVPAAQVLGQRAFDRFPHLVEVGVDRLFFCALAGETTVVENYEVVTDGVKRFFDRHYAPLRDVEGSVIGGVGVVRDVTARRAAEEALRERDALFRSVVENASEAIGILDAQGSCIYANPALERILGYEKGELVGFGALTQAHPDDHARAAEGLARVVSDVGAAVAIEARWQHKDGSWRLLDGRATSFLERGGAPGDRNRALRVVLHARDVTEQRVAQKMEAIGRVAGGVAHDFNNLLTVVLSCTDLLSRQIGAGPSGAYVAEIANAAERGAALIRQLLTFSTTLPVKARAVDLNAVVVEAQGLLGRLIGEQIVLTSDLDPEAGHALGDPGQIEQVILNLVLNARDAIGGRAGRIALSTRGAGDGDGDGAGAPGDDPYVMLRVEDDGVGMSDEVKAHLFEPFFTTKPRGQGTGLGLATVYGIVQRTGGRVSVRSAPGEGTTIEVLLPRGRAIDEPPAPSARPAVRARGEERILLVEDEAPLRRVIREVLEESGYEVVEAADGTEAMRTITELVDDGRGVDLVLSDVAMPGTSGRELAAGVRARWPSARVLLMSGYDEHAAKEGAEPVLGKPFTAVALARRVREVLGGSLRANPKGVGTP